VLRVACDEEAVVVLEVLLERGEAVGYGFAGVVFVVDALWAGGCGEVCVCGLAGISCCIAVVSVLIDVFELQRVDEGL
jgi:hypothetical protein